MSHAEKQPAVAYLSTMHANAETLYDQALTVSLQWFSTYDKTGDPRHLQTALICSTMARDRYFTIMIEHRTRRLNSSLTFAERQADLEATVSYVTATVDRSAPRRSRLPASTA